MVDNVAGIMLDVVEGILDESLLQAAIDRSNTDRKMRFLIFIILFSLFVSDYLEPDIYRKPDDAITRLLNIGSRIY
jgi:hypothetical protein